MTKAHANEFKKGDRIRVTTRKPAGFVPAAGCTKGCCDLTPHVYETEVRKVFRKRNRLQIGLEHGGYCTLIIEEAVNITVEKIAV